MMRWVVLLNGNGWIDMDPVRCKVRTRPNVQRFRGDLDRTSQIFRHDLEESDAVSTPSVPLCLGVIPFPREPPLPQTAVVSSYIDLPDETSCSSSGAGFQ